MAKKKTSGNAILKTSIGIETIILPFKLNIKTIVNNKEIKVIGEIKGINLVLNHSSPLILIKLYRLIIAAIKGIPK